MHRLTFAFRKGLRFWFPRNQVENCSREDVLSKDFTDGQPKGAPGGEAATCRCGKEARATFLEAIGWGGVIALGYQLVTPLCYFLSNIRRDCQHYKECVCLDVQSLLRAAGLTDYASLRCAILPDNSSRKSSKTRSKRRSKRESGTLEEQLEIARRELFHSENLYIRDMSLENGIGWYQRGEDGYKEAAHSWRIASDLGSSRAAFYLGFLYQYGLGEEVDLAKAVEMYTTAADKGEARAMYHLGELLLKTNPEEGNAMLRKAAVRGVEDPTHPDHLILNIMSPVERVEYEPLDLEVFEILKSSKTEGEDDFQLLSESNDESFSSEASNIKQESTSSSLLFDMEMSNSSLPPSHVDSQSSSPHQFLDEDQDVSCSPVLRHSLSSPDLSTQDRVLPQLMPHSKSWARLSSVTEEGGYFSGSDGPIDNNAELIVLYS